MSNAQPETTTVQQPLTDDSLVVRQITHFQFSWVAGEAGEPGTHTLQLVLDQGAFEEVLTLPAFDSIALQFKLAASPTAFYDKRTRSVITPTTPVGAGFFLAAAAAS